MVEIQKSDYDRENKLWMFMPVAEEREYFMEVCTRVINNPRFYLDNLEELHVFRVSWYRYKRDSEQLSTKKWYKEALEPKSL